MNDITPIQAAEIMANLQAGTPSSAPVDLDAIGAAYLANARRESAIAEWGRACPPDMQHSDFTRAELAPYEHAIQRVLDHNPTHKGILASGRTGRGKTRAMWALMRRLAVDGGIEVRCYHAQDFFGRLQAQISFGRDDAAGWVETVARRQIVFIDDFGQQAITSAREDWAMGWFFRFLDIRVGEKLPLYLTTNLRASDMTADATNSRVRGAAIRSDPLLRRLLDLCDPVRFESEIEAAQHNNRQAA